MKFFDLNNKGNLSKLDFLKAIAKCGVVIDTHVLSFTFRIWKQFFSITQQKTDESTTKISLNNCSLSKINLNQIPAESNQTIVECWDKQLKIKATSTTVKLKKAQE